MSSSLARSGDLSGLIDQLAGLGLGDRDAIEKQANDHAYIFGSNAVPLAFSQDWASAAKASQGVPGGWVRALHKARLAAALRSRVPSSAAPSSSSTPSSPTPSSSTQPSSMPSSSTSFFSVPSSMPSTPSSRGPPSATAPPADLAKHIRAMSPAELSWRLQQDPRAMITCMNRAGLKSWHGRWFVIVAGSPPDVTNSIPHLYENVSGMDSAANPCILYAGEQLTAYDLFCYFAIRWQLRAIPKGPGASSAQLIHFAVAKASKIAQRWPWLPCYAAHCERADVSLPPPEDPQVVSPILTHWIDSLAQTPVEQPVPGHSGAANASECFLASPRLDIRSQPFRSTPGSPLSPDTHLSFETDPLIANASARRNRGERERRYVVFVGWQVGVFATELAREAYEGISCAVQCAYRTELDAQRAFQQAWLFGDVDIRES
ncbi:hypothetical protein PENSPDRAFT_694870 [Peniophora sp. CONT]|nr:hypothetical protein PENSPDRAFT_694870 [Peniophora sp. CONT]